MNYTFNYLRNIEKYKTLLLESVLEEQNLNKLFYGNPMDLRELFNVANEDQLRFIFYKIKEDLPNIELTKKINDMIAATKTKNFNAAANEIKTIIEQNFKVYFSNNNDPVIVKLYNSIFKPFNFTNTPPPPPLENFGNPYSPSTPTDTDSATQDATDASTGSATPQDTITPAPAPDPQPSDVPATPPPGPGTPTNLPPNREAEARGQQIRQGSSYRQGARSSQAAVKPISPKGGPTYYIRTSPGRYRPAVQADMDANIPLFIKNPNPIAAMVNPYVRVSDEIRRARRAGPVDQQAVDREMRASVGGQRIGPGGLRYEKGGRVERKSKLPGAAGSLSNFLGDIGNTLTGR